ncbi:MAG: hypothetical protein AAF721_20000 [Myxococcota bacterium]
MNSTGLGRRVRVWMASGAIAAGALGMTVGSSARADDDPCQAKSFSVSAVEKACKSGGRKAAKTVMKAAVKKAKAAGESMTCKTCHDNLKTFSLTGNAVADLEKWI